MTPVLLFGMPRSGTTWIGKIFDSHPDTVYRHEPDSHRRMDDIPFAPNVSDLERYRDAIEAYFASLPGLNAPKVCAKLPLFRKSYLSHWELLALHGGAFVAKLADRLGRSAPVLGAPRVDPASDLWLVWKSIESLGRLGVIVRALPRARALHIVRHPCGYASSVVRGEARGSFVDKTASSEDYGLFELLMDTAPAHRYGLSLASLGRLQPLERLAWRWVLLNEKAMEDLQGLPACALLRYEDLCADPMEVAREYLEFAGPGWHSQCARFIRDSTGRDSDSYYSVYRAPLQAAHRWQEELPRDAVDRIIGTIRETRPGGLYGDEPIPHDALVPPSPQSTGRDHPPRGTV